MNIKLGMIAFSFPGGGALLRSMQICLEQTHCNSISHSTWNHFTSVQNYCWKCSPHNNKENTRARIPKKLSVCDRKRVILFLFPMFPLKMWKCVFVADFHVLLMFWLVNGMILGEGFKDRIKFVSKGHQFYSLLFM